MAFPRFIITSYLHHTCGFTSKSKNLPEKQQPLAVDLLYELSGFAAANVRSQGRTAMESDAFSVGNAERLLPKSHPLIWKAIRALTWE